jgi:hypothetical protein
MEDLEMVQVGTDVNNNPVFNVKNKGGGLISTTIFTKDEAQALIDGGGNTSTELEPALALMEKARIVVDTTPNYENMTKVELEAMMRLHNIELDRRKSKKDLLSQVRKHFNK